MTLLEQLRNATEGSWELDARLWCLANDREFHGMYGCTDKPEKNGRFVKFSYKTGQMHKGNDTQLFSLFPHYTTNLQDTVSQALSMGATSITVQWRRGELAKVMMGFPWDEGVPYSGAGYTLALAASEAIIKAHESKEAEAA